jgi:hypothetical protein
MSTTASRVDYVAVERALLGTTPITALDTVEANFCAKYRPAFNIGRMAGQMARGYYAHCAAIEVAKDPRASSLIPEALPGQPIPVARVARKDGTAHVYSLLHYLEWGRSDQDLVHDFQRVWLIGSLMAIGDALSKCGYLNRAPLLELIRHLRNGIAHGNIFEIRDPSNLKRYPANNRGASFKADEFEITPSLHCKPVLFDFMGAGDILDVLMSTEVYLTNVRERQSAGELESLLRGLP